VHKSKLAGFIIDCRTEDLPAAASFWGNALGMAVHDVAGDAGKLYRALGDPHGLAIEVQKVEHPSRVHLDIETDDISAEVARLEALGASENLVGHGGADRSPILRCTFPKREISGARRNLAVDLCRVLYSQIET
jgi:predicted enzyme related to lactoylglutathione lyase